jgi:hypothetical protein
MKAAFLAEGCKVNHYAHKSECPGGAGQNAEQITNDLNYPTGQRHSKAESNLRAVLALAGHAVHLLKDGGYLVCKYGYTYEAKDFSALNAFAVRLGVCHE